MNFSASEICFCSLIFSLQLVILAKQFIFKSNCVLPVLWCREIIARGFIITSGISYQSPGWNKLDKTACDRLDLTSLLRFVSTNLLQVVNLHATSLLSTICYSIVTTVLLQVSQQVGTSLLEHLVIGSAKTSCWQVVGTTLLQVCCRLVTICTFLRVYVSEHYNYSCLAGGVNAWAGVLLLIAYALVCARLFKFLYT